MPDMITGAELQWEALNLYKHTASIVFPQVLFLVKPTGP